MQNIRPNIPQNSDQPPGGPDQLVPASFSKAVENDAAFDGAAGVHIEELDEMHLVTMAGQARGKRANLRLRAADIQGSDKKANNHGRHETGPPTRRATR